MSAFQIEGFAANSPAMEAGLQLGDILLEIDGQQFDSIDDLNSAIPESSNSFSVLVYRNGRQFNAELRGHVLGCSLVRQAVPESVVQAKRDAVLELIALKSKGSPEEISQESDSVSVRLVKCSTCGASVSTNAKFCPSCGEVDFIKAVNVGSVQALSSKESELSKAGNVFVGLLGISSLVILMFAILTGGQDKNSSNEQSNQVMNAEFRSLSSCLSGIERNTGMKLQIITDKPEIVSGFLSNGKHFGCKRVISGSKGIYYEGWYGV